MQEEKNKPTVDDFCKALEKSSEAKVLDQIRNSIEGISNDKEPCEKNFKYLNIYDKEYFENVALKYLKAIPSNMTYYDAKYNLCENMEMVERYPLLKNVLIHMNPIETVRVGLDLISAKIALRYQITVSEVLAQLSGGN